MDGKGNARITIYRLALALALCLASFASAVAQGAAAESEAAFSFDIQPRTEAIGAEHVVRRGDALYDIARRHATTVETLMRLNGIEARHHIVAGRRIKLPLYADAPVKPGFGYGIALYADADKADELARRAYELGVDWAKLDVVWAEIEAERGLFDFAALDATIAALHDLGLKVMLNVYAAPAWSRADYAAVAHSELRDAGGPPSDLDDFAGFMRVLAGRYAGRVDAYEIWKSPNLLKYWYLPQYAEPPVADAHGDYALPDAIQIGAAHYLPLLEAAFRAVKAVDASAQVITAGLAPVGFSDNYNAVETGTFLHNMLHEGALDYSDAIGAIFSASAVPPARFCCEKPPGVATHYESYMQYFRETLYLYRDMLSAHGVDKPIIITQAGWGTNDGVNLALPSRGVEWLRYTDEGEQARYAVQAFDLARRMDGVAGMMAYNLNGCAAGLREACFFSLVDAAGRQRPAAASLRGFLAASGH